MKKKKEIKCRCGGTLRKSQCEVEYLDNKIMTGIEKLVKVTKSGNSIVVRIPPEIAKLSKLHYKSLVRIFPTGEGKISLEVKD